MGGTIEVESKEGEGTRFIFSISFTVPPSETLSITTEITSEVMLPELNILLVDDIEPNRKVIHKFLEGFTVSITDAENGQEAIENFNRNRYDLILMDVEMPVMNGLEATKTIRALEKENNQPPTPLIVLSAHAFGEQRKKCYESGCDDLLVKPVRKKDFLLSIAKLTTQQELQVTSPELTPPADVFSDFDAESGNTVHIDSIFEELFPDFIDYFHESLENMNRATANEDYNELFRLGHGLKGSASNYELYDLGNIFLKIEKAAEEKKMETIIFNLKKAKDYIDTVKVEFVNKET